MKILTAPPRRKTLSIVTPCYNEEGGITLCHAAVRRVMARLPDYDYEHIFIDNNSQDRTVGILRALAAGDPRTRLILNARNFGPARSPHHAMLEASGDAVIPVLADLQTPPELIPELVARWEAGARVVVAVRRTSAEPALSRAVRGAFYRLMERVSEVEHIPNFMGYGLYDRQVMDTLRTLNEPDPYFRGLITEVGFERAVVGYDQPARLHGRSKNSLSYLISYAVLGMSSYSRAPLRLMTLGGFVIAAISFCIGLAYLAAKLAFWNSLPMGVAPVLIAVFFLGAVQIFALGVVGEYVGLLLTYVRRFPLVVEKERVNFEAPLHEAPLHEATAGEPAQGARQPGQQGPMWSARGGARVDSSHAGARLASTT